jgi:hypothetical protein
MPRPHTGPWGVVRSRCCACLAPPLGSAAPLPPSAEHAQSDEGEEECRGLGDLLGAADHGINEGVDVKAVDLTVQVHVPDGIEWAVEKHVDERIDVESGDKSPHSKAESGDKSPHSKKRPSTWMALNWVSTI